MELYQTFAKHELRVAGQRLHYVDHGEGPAVVLVHGSPLSSFSFRHQIQSLSRRFRVLAPDMLGFGRSTAPARGAGFLYQVEALREWLDQVDPGPIRLLGHDWGGPISMAAVSRKPEQLKKLVLMNTSILPDFQPPRYWRAFTSRGLGDLIVVKLNTFGRGLPLLMKAARSPQVQAVYSAPLREKATRRTALLLERLGGFRRLMEQVELALPKMQVPTLILWGHPDPYFRQNELERLRQLVKGAQLHRMPGAGHFPQEDDPEAVTRALEAFF